MGSEGAGCFAAAVCSAARGGVRDERVRRGRTVSSRRRTETRSVGALTSASKPNLFSQPKSRPASGSTARAIAFTANAIALRTTMKAVASRQARGPGRASTWTPSVDVDERADRRVRLDLGGLGVGHLDAAKALREAVRGADEAVQGVAAVEVADLRDAGIAVVAAVRVGAGHRRDRQVLEHGEHALRGRGRGNAGVDRTGDDVLAVVPDVDRLGAALADVDVRVAEVRDAVRDRRGDQRLPDLRARRPRPGSSRGRSRTPSPRPSSARRTIPAATR